MLAGTALLTGAVVEGASAVNADHGNRVVSPKPVSFTPHAMDGSVNAIVQVGQRIVAAGTFTRVSPSGTFDDTSDDLIRNGIFAFDATTGVIDPDFNPNLDGSANSLATDGTSVYVAGTFTAVGGVATHKRIAKLSADGTVSTAFKVQPNKAVNEVVARSGRVYIGGVFTSIKNGTVTHNRGALAALDANTGAVLAGVNLPFTGVYDPNNNLNGKMGGVTHVARFDVTADGRKLAAVGNFAKVNGQTRVQVAVIDTNIATTGVATVSPWATNRFDRAHNSCAAVFDTWTRDIDFSPDGSFFAITTTGAYAGGSGSGTLCDTSSRWETNSTGNEPTWVDYTGGDTSYGVAVTGDVVYVGGHFRWQNNPFRGDSAGPGAVPRSGIAALDATNGLPLSWNPGRTRGVGAQALYATPEGLWVGSDTTRFKNLTRGRIAFVPLSDGTTIPSVAPATLPNTLFIAQSGGLRSRSLDGSGAPTGSAAVVNTAFDWSTVRGAFYLNGTLYYLSGSGLYARAFNPATGAVGEARSVSLNGLVLDTSTTPISGMFYDPGLHRIYYAKTGSNGGLFYRYFTPESELVGALEFRANTNGVDFRNVAGMTLAGGRLLYGSTSDRALRSVAFGAGGVTGTPTVVSSDGSWGASRGMFVPND
jgi:hypothetical protein